MVRQFASRQNVGAIATFVVTFAITSVVWPHVPNAILIPWVAVQIVIALGSTVRWNPVRQLDKSAANAHMLMKEAVAWKAIAGAMWGALAAISSFYLPQSLEFFTAIAVAAVAVGAVSTIATIPKAAYAFIVLSFAPFIVVWLTGGDMAYVTLGLLSILLLAVIMNSARVAHRQIFAVLRTELELRQLTEEFETARGEWLELSDTTESYVVFDPQDRLVAWDKRYAELLQIPSELLHRGTPRADLIKRARQAVDVTSGNVQIDHWLQQRTDPKNNELNETSVTEYEGGLWIQRRSQYSSNGNLVISHVDLTELVQLEIAQRESDERYRLIAENSPDAIFIRVDEEIVYVNPAAVRILRAKSEGDLLGLSLLSLYHPGDRNIALGNRATLAQGSTDPIPLIRTRMRRFDGTYVMTAGSGADHTWNGRPAVLVTRRDITAQIETEERLRESERRYRRIADLSPVGILIRTDDRIVYANPAAIKMFGAESEADLLYETMMSFVHPDDHHLVVNNRANMTQDTEDAAPLTRVRRRRFDGSYFHSEGSGAPFVWQGQPAVMVMLRDITGEVETDPPALARA